MYPAYNSYEDYGLYGGPYGINNKAATTHQGTSTPVGYGVRPQASTPVKDAG